MSKRQPNPKPIQRRPDRHQAVQAKRAASAMASVEDLAATLGVGRNLAYALIQRGGVPGGMRLGRRWLIPRAMLAKITTGELTITISGTALKGVAKSRRGNLGSRKTAANTTEAATA